MTSPEKYLTRRIDLRGTPCPVNFVRCCLALEQLDPNEVIEFDLDKGQPEEMVIPGILKAGHAVQQILEESEWIRISVICNGS